MSAHDVIDGLLVVLGIVAGVICVRTWLERQHDNEKERKR